MNTILEEVGPFGLFQKISLLIIGLVDGFIAMTFYVTIFNTSEPKLTCIDLVTSNKTNDICIAWNNFTLSKSYYDCKFDDDIYGKTIVTDWSLLCEKSYLVTLTQTIFLFGGISGFLSGFISDKYGRKIASLLFLGTFLISSITYNILVNDFVGLSIQHRLLVYNIFQFINGGLNLCIFNSIYALLIELTTCRYHTLFTNVTIYFYVLGEILIMGVYYFTKNWIISNMFITVYAFVFTVLFALFVPESPLWLVEVKRYNEAYEVLKRMARINGIKNYSPNREVTIRILKQRKIEYDILNNDDSDDFDTDVNELDSSKKRCFNNEILTKLFCSSKNFIKLIALAYIFCSVSLNYYAVAIGVTTMLQINPYLMYLLSAVFEFIGLVLCHINDVIGRRKGILFYFASLTISSFLFAVLPDDSEDAKIKWFLIAKACFSLLARLMISAAFNTLIVFTAELYEVKLRTTVLMLLGSLGGIGSLLAPTVISLRTLVWEPMPYCIYAALSFISTVIVFLLPETYKN